MSKLWSEKFDGCAIHFTCIFLSDLKDQILLYDKVV